jgi:hypothetical protein
LNGPSLVFELSTPTSETAADGPSELAAVEVSEFLGSSGRRMIFRFWMTNGGVFAADKFGRAESGGALEQLV